MPPRSKQQERAMTAERLPWFPCYPGALLGALSAMEPDEGYVYVVTLLRIYETGGPICDDDITLARRTGLSRKRVAQMIERLRHTGKLIATADGRLDNPVAAAEISKQNALIKSRSETAAENAVKRWKKAKQIQRQTDTAALPGHNGGIAGAMPDDAHLHLHIQEQEKKDSRSVAIATRPPDDDFEKLWSIYPKREGSNPKKPARIKYEKMIRDGVDHDQLVAAVKCYADQEAKNVGTRFISRTVKWLTQWSPEDDAPSQAVTAATKKWNPVLVDSATGRAWHQHHRTTKHVSPPETDYRWPTGAADARLQRCYSVPAEFLDLPAAEPDHQPLARAA
jgi:uncharacterized protein YdaU (DUF1376 family)